MSAAHMLNGNNSDTYYKSLYDSERTVSNTLKAKCDSLKLKQNEDAIEIARLIARLAEQKEKNPASESYYIGPAFMVFFVLLMLGLTVVYLGENAKSSGKVVEATPAPLPSATPATVPSPTPSVVKSPTPSVVKSPTPSVVKSPTPQTVLKALPLPRSGDVRQVPDIRRVAPFEIKTEPGQNYLVKLALPSDPLGTVMSVFVRGGDTVEIKAPLGTYILKYAAGTTWYGYKKNVLFGPSTTYTQADSLFTFTATHGHSVTLYTVSDGNLSTSDIKAQQF